MPTVKTIQPHSQQFGRVWKGCVKCGKPEFHVVLPYDTGTVAPVEDEVLTGATSLDTGVVESWTVESGSWAGGDAAGRIYMKTATGISNQNAWGQDNEAVTGSTAAALVANGTGWQILSGRMHPLDHLVHRDGKYYCKAHYDMVFGDEGLDTAGQAIDKSESGRGDEPY